MPYTTQGFMTPADMEDLADLYDWNAGQDEERAEEEAMEAAHATHADECAECQQEATQRETTARVALAFDDARRALEKGIQEALVILDARDTVAARGALKRALAESRKAMRNI